MLTDLAMTDDSVRRTPEYRAWLGNALLEARGAVERGVAIECATLTEAQWARVAARVHE